MKETTLNLNPAIATPSLNKGQIYVHHAIQYIAIAGKYLLETKADDSHTNMRWDSKSEQFIGNLILDRAFVAFHIPTFSLRLLGPTQLILAEYPLIGKTKEEGFVWLKQALQLKQINPEALSMDLHYDIPSIPIDQGSPFPKIEDEVLNELSKHRTLAELVGIHFSSKYAHASPVRTWPHHFDHGSYIPFCFDDKEEVVQSFSIGYAIADTIIDEPYFYVTQWHKSKEVNYSAAPPLNSGDWYPDKLRGSALRLTEIFTAKDTLACISSFLDQSISWSTKV